MTATWTASPAAVERVITAVLSHASTARGLPLLNAVRLELDGDQFLAVATDRYSLGICRASIADWTEEDDVKPVEKQVASLRTDDVKRLFAFLKPHRTAPAVWELSDDKLTVNVPAGPSLTVPVSQFENFPKWRAILGPLLDLEPMPGAQMAFTPCVVDHFHRSAKVLGELSMRWQFISHIKPVIVRIGDDFLGILMPCRIPDDAPELDLAAFGIAKAVAA